MAEVAEAYEVRMGRWSRQLAPLFVEFAGVEEGEHVLDANELTGKFWGAAIAIDPTAKRRAKERGKYRTVEALSNLLKDAGLHGIHVIDLTTPCRFSSFDDYWLPLAKGQGPSGAYLAELSENHQAALRKQLRQNLLADRSDGPFTLTAKSWAVKGIVP
jgi:hypothetical protein